MQRTQSVSLSIDKFSGSSPPRTNSGPIERTSSMVVLDLPAGPDYEDTDQYDKGKRHWKLRSEHAVHLIPVVLIFCALVLWMGSQSVN